MPKNSVNWHSAIISGFRIEWRDYENILTYRPEFTLNTGSRRIDCMIEKEPGSGDIPSPIASRFRHYNLIDYKSPHESMSITNYHKVLSYAHSLPDFFHSEQIFSELTITLVTHRYPRKLFRYLTEKLGKNLEKIIPGLYYIDKEICHFQIVVLQELPSEEYLWLHCLTNALPPDAPLHQLGHIYRNHKEETDYRNFMNTLIRANHLQKGLDRFMCEALYELFNDYYAEEIAEKLSDAEEQGLKQGMQQAMTLIQRLISDDRSADIARVAADPLYRDQLLAQYHL